MRIKLTDAQAGAIECRHLEGDEAALGAAWDGDRILAWGAKGTEELLDALTEASNAEDGQHTETGCQFARRASAVLCNVADKVIRAAKEYQDAGWHGR